MQGVEAPLWLRRRLIDIDTCARFPRKMGGGRRFFIFRSNNFFCKSFMLCQILKQRLINLVSLTKNEHFPYSFQNYLT